VNQTKLSINDNMLYIDKPPFFLFVVVEC